MYFIPRGFQQVCLTSCQLVSFAAVSRCAECNNNVNNAKRMNKNLVLVQNILWCMPSAPALFTSALLYLQLLTIRRNVPSQPRVGLRPRKHSHYTTRWPVVPDPLSVWVQDTMGLFTWPWKPDHCPITGVISLFSRSCKQHNAISFIR